MSWWPFYWVGMLLAFGLFCAEAQSVEKDGKKYGMAIPALCSLLSWWTVGFIAGLELYGQRSKSKRTP